MVFVSFTCFLLHQGVCNNGWRETITLVEPLRKATEKLLIGSNEINPFWFYVKIPLNFSFLFSKGKVQCQVYMWENFSFLMTADNDILELSVHQLFSGFKNLGDIYSFLSL